MHLELPPIQKYPWYLRLFYLSQKKKFGQVLIPTLFWGQRPLLLILFILFWKYLDRKNSPLAPGLRALVQVRTAQMNWCQFCIDYNALSLIERTHSLEKYTSLEKWKQSSLFSVEETIALEMAETLSNSQVQIPDELMLRMKEKFDKIQIIELIALISFQNMSAKFNAGLGIPSQGLCRIENNK